MTTPTNAQLGKLLASYFSTSNDALAINFRKHYSPTFSTPSLQKSKTKRINAAVTEATFIYRHAPKHAARIVTLYQHLLKAQWIAPDTNSYAHACTRYHYHHCVVKQSNSVSLEPQQLKAV